MSFVEMGLPSLFSLLYFCRERDRYHCLGRFCPSRAWYRLWQVREMENAEQTRARVSRHGTRTPGKSSKPYESRTRDGSPAGINAAISHELSFRS